VRRAGHPDLENRYHELFEVNPLPMWVFDLGTLRFMAVNEAAIAKYGYSREEFLSMSIEDIRPAEDVARLRSVVSSLPRAPATATRANGSICARTARASGSRSPATPCCATGGPPAWCWPRTSPTAARPRSAPA
jgi:PAS domain S-box-containing protein